ncbi:MAG TPA: metalloregulator ArsR/SmtB family transcription factor [Acidimicrobiia bacterium]|nr:metalloregulator ArsR/SmtB family transcription factor [Acidimicrobiia bacterium]
MLATDQFDALGDPTRREVMGILLDRPRSVGEIAARLPVSRPAVSQHLKVLERSGLVTHRAEGTRRIYSTAPSGLDELRRAIEQMWDDTLARFAAAAEEEKP